ncbi:MAG TPA: hypothetical protein VJ819_10440, partial [Nocardioidaceae bacterium]|nr:hypothetical protein [Nocardioidaceae bacterium]
MPRRDQYVPKHRNAPAEPAVSKSRRKSVLFSTVAVAATSIAVSGGVLAQESAPTGAAAGAISTVQADR